MKPLFKILLVSSILSVSVIYSCGKSQSQKEKAPEKVEATFKQKFPQATEVEWEKENDTEWEGEFKMNGKKYSANFKNDGEWIETEHEIAISEIPATIKTNVDSTYAGYKIEEAEISETTGGNQYELKLEKGKETIEVVYTVDGIFIKQSSANAQTDDKD